MLQNIDILRMKVFIFHYVLAILNENTVFSGNHFCTSLIKFGESNCDVYMYF